MTESLAPEPEDLEVVAHDDGSEEDEELAACCVINESNV